MLVKSKTTRKKCVQKQNCHISPHPKKKSYFIFPLLGKKKIWYFHSLTRFWAEFLKNNLVTGGKKNTVVLDERIQNSQLFRMTEMQQ